ncbi:MAG: VOC family protein [Thermoplasmata archaeon]
MDFETYRKAYFTDPPPAQAFPFIGRFGVTLYFEDFEAAIAYYSEVLGPPGYVEGEGTRGWAIGSGWLTLLKGKAGNPSNVEITFEVESVEEAERLQLAFITKGGKGSDPSDELMYRPVRSCPATDPFGTDILVIAQLETG